MVSPTAGYPRAHWLFASNIHFQVHVQPHTDIKGYLLSDYFRKK